MYYVFLSVEHLLLSYRVGDGDNVKCISISVVLQFYKYKVAMFYFIHTVEAPKDDILFQNILVGKTGTFHVNKLSNNIYLLQNLLECALNLCDDKN